MTTLIHHLLGFLWLAYLAPAVILSFFTYKINSWYYRLTIVHLLKMLQKHVEKGNTGLEELKTVLDARRYSEVKRHLKKYKKAEKNKKA